MGVTFKKKRRTKGNTPNPDSITRQPMWWKRYAHNTGNWRRVVAQMRQLNAEARTTRIRHGLSKGQRHYS